MKLRHSVIFALSCNLSLHGMLMDSIPQIKNIEAELKSAEKKSKTSLSSQASQLVDFSYKQEPLKEILNHFAAKLNFNILYPETESITTLASFDAGKKITLCEAWNFVQMILEQAGYTLIMRDASTYVIMSTSKSFQESLPLFIGVNPEQLPDNMQRVRFVYFFNNIQVSKQQAELTTILNNMLPATDLTNQLKFDPYTNTMILTTRADVIKNIMQLITILDETGFEQAVELLKLQHAQAKDVVELFKSILGPDAAKKNAPINIAAGTRTKYFSENIRVENLDPNNIRQLNTIVLIGKPEDIESVRTFIKKYIDIAQDKGNSFFHVVDVQWMQASHLANVLNNLIKGGSSSSGQSSSTPSVSELSFDPQIQIMAETVQQGPTNTESVSSSGQQNTIQRGANRLVIACTPRDWERLEPLIKQIDIPQKQVLIEALVVDLNLEFVRKLGSQIRTRGIVPSIFPKNLQAQAGLLDYNVIQPMPDPDYYSLCGDLSDILNPDWPGSGTPDLTQPNVPTTIPQPGVGSANAGFAGSTVLMLSGGKSSTNGAWALFQILAQHTTSKIFTRPTLLVANNQTGFTQSIFTKNLAGQVTQGTNPTINYQQVDAPVKVHFTPLISDNNIVSLQLDINLINWINTNDASNGDQIIRQIKTNVSMKSGDVLILGGLSKEQTQVSKRSMPFLESIPIIGNFFASRTKDSLKSKLFIVVRITVCEPQRIGQMNKMTQSASNYMVDQLTEVENNFTGLKDPVTRWFFNNGRYESASEFFEEKITEMPKNDYGVSELEYKTAHTGQKILHSQQNPEKITVGWFSDAPSNHPYASKAVTEQSSDMDKLSALLKDMNNPFTRVVL